MINAQAYDLLTRLNTWRDIANFSSMACEKLLRKNAIVKIVDKSFIALNTCLFVKEGKSLVDRCIAVKKKDVLTWKFWSPRIANILNIAALASSILYFMGYTNPYLFVIGCASRIVPYATNFFRQSRYTSIAARLEGVTLEGKVPSNPNKNRSIIDWLQPTQMLEKIKMALNAPNPTSVREEVDQLLQEWRGIKELQNIYATYITNIQVPSNKNAKPQTPSAFNPQLKKTRLSENMLIEMRKGIKEVTDLIPQLKNVQGKELESNALQAKISEKIDEWDRKVIDLINLELYSPQVKKIANDLKKLLTLDDLINFSSLVLGIIYVSLLAYYYDQVPYEGAIYLLSLCYGAYDLWKEWNVSSLENQYKQLNNLKIDFSNLKADGLDE